MTTYANNKLQIKTVPTRLVLEYSFAAYRINLGYYKEVGFQDLTTNNRTIIDHCVKNWINKNNSGSTLAYWLPSDFVAVEITDEDRQGADQVYEHFKKYMFNSLAGKLSHFENDIYTAICSDEIALTKVGLIAYVPELINRDRVKWQFEKTVKTEYKNSCFQKVDKVEADMIVFRVYEFESSYCNTVRSVISGYNGNLYHFYDKKRVVELGSEGKKYHISARVKDWTKENSTGAIMTRLNYVKVKPCQNQ